MTRIEHHGRPKLKDIAAAANVSIMTASRALRGVDGVSEAKRQEILKIASDLSYLPNLNARSLVVENSDLVGVSMPTLYNDVFAGMLAGMRQTFEHAGLATVFDTTNYNPMIEQAWVERILSWRPAAMVLTGIDHTPLLKENLRRSGVPTLEIWDTAPDPIDICVGIDHEHAGYVAGVYARRLGYLRPAYVGALEGRDTRADKRLAGLSRAFGRTLATSLNAEENAYKSGGEGALDLMGRDPAPDVIFFLNDHLAFGGLMACERAGILCPRDIGIVGFNGLDLATTIHLPMTTVRTPRRAIGVMGARNLLARINGLEVEPSLTLPVQLVEGSTTRLR